MRTWLMGCALLLAPGALAMDQGDCMQKCSARSQTCLAGCKDDRCIKRCASHIEDCSKGCESKPVNGKYVDAAKKDAKKYGNKER